MSSPLDVTTILARAKTFHDAVTELHSDARRLERKLSQADLKILWRGKAIAYETVLPKLGELVRDLALALSQLEKIVEQREADVRTLARKNLELVRDAPELDQDRWSTIEHALTTPDLHSDVARLTAIRCVVNSRKPLTVKDTARAQEIAKRLGLLEEAAEAALSSHQEEKKGDPDVPR